MKNSIYDYEEAISNLLIHMGITANLEGYRCLRTAILLVMEDEEMIRAVTKKLYPAVAKKHNITPTSAERAMRHALEMAFRRGGLSKFQRKPTTSEFIALIAEKLLRKFRRELSNE